MNLRTICLPLLLCAIFARGEELSRFEFSQPHMGTLFSIVLFAPDSDRARKAAAEAFERIAQLDNIMSDYKADSELNRLSRDAAAAPVKISGDLFEVMSRAQALARQTDGAFDITVGPLVRLWRKARRARQLPDAESIAGAKARVGFQNLQLDEKTQTARLLKDGMQLDLGGIAKGYAADAALKLLQARGIRCALVAAAGDIAVSDAPPGKDAWTVAIAPLADESSQAREAKGVPEKAPKVFLLLKNAAVSTSGDTEQFVEIGGKRYSHIVDPRTGIGLTVHSSVTVVAPNATLSDALATAASVLGEAGLKIVDATEDTAALIVQDSGGGKEKHLESARWRDVQKLAPK